VNWTSANPRPTTGSTPPVYRNGRATILATAIGEESFDDVHQTGYYESGDPFSDLGEPYLDANESGAYVSGDYYYNFYNQPQWEGPSGVFKGITCSGSTCTATTLGIGVSHLLIMSTSAAGPILANPSGFSIPASTAASGQTPAMTSTQAVTFTVQDQNKNPMAAGTTVTAALDNSALGTLTGVGTNFTIGCRSGGGPADGQNGWTGDTLPLTFTAGTSPASGNIVVTITSPQSKSSTVFTIPVDVQ
jgi:hypothetical protein